MNNNRLSYIMLCRGVLKGFWAAIIWTRIGVGIGSLGGLGKTARRRNRNEVKGKELVGFGGKWNGFRRCWNAIWDRGRIIWELVMVERSME